MTYFQFEVGPLLRGFPDFKDMLRVSQVLTRKNPIVGVSDTQEPVVRKKTVSGAKTVNRGINPSIASVELLWGCTL